MPLLRIMGEMRLLPEHRADARDLEHQPLPADRALYRIGGQETPGLFGEIEQDRAGFPQDETGAVRPCIVDEHRSVEHTSELQSLMRISYAVFCLKQKKQE